MNELLLTIALIHGVDAGTACYGLHLASQQTRYTVTETNPIAKDCTRIVPLKALTAGASMWVVRDLQQKGHPKLARLMSVVSISPSSVGIVFNLRVVRTLRREIGTIRAYKETTQ